jgi:hypothetical protein
MGPGRRLDRARALSPNMVPPVHRVSQNTTRRSIEARGKDNFVTSEQINTANYWRNNGELIADVASLGFIRGNVLDAAYGAGAFWTSYTPSNLTSNDLYTPADYSYNFTEFPLNWENKWDTTVLDAPYKLNGTPSQGQVDKAYGVHKKATIQERMDLIIDGAKECYRITKGKGFILVKVQDQVSSGKMHFQTDAVSSALKELGAVKVAQLHFLRSPRQQPQGRRQVHPRSNFSTLMVFKKR